MDRIDAETPRVPGGRTRANRLPSQECAWAVREEEFSQMLLRLAQAAARRRGLPYEEAQDCGIGFVVHMLTDTTLLERVRAGEEVSPAWLHTCAEHWTANVVRYRQRLCAREHLAAIPMEAIRTSSAVQIGSREAALPEAQILRSELMQRVLAATFSLTDSQRDLFTQRYLYERSITEIAYQTERTPGAIKQALANLRQRLHTLLIREGLTYEEVAQYLHLLALPVVPAVAGTRHTRE